jgi:hypothetical protein
MKHVSISLMIMLLMISYVSNAQTFETTISATDNKHDMISPMKSTATFQFSVSVTNKSDETYVVSIDKPGMLPLDSWVTIDNNTGRSLTKNSQTTFLITITIPTNTQEGDYLLLVNYKAVLGSTSYSVAGKTLTVIVDNSGPNVINLSVDYTTSSTVRVFYDGIDARSSEYSNFNLGRTDCGYNGIKNFTVVLKDGSGATKESKTLDATQTRAYLFSTNASLSPNTQYYYSVQATDMAGNSNTSAAISAKTKVGKPTNFRISSSSYCRLTLTWDLIPGASSYLIGYHGGTLNSVTTNSYTFNSLNPATQYSFDIRSVGSEGNGDILTQTFSTPAVLEPKLLGNLAICSSSGDVQVRAIGDATSYEWTVQSPLTVNGAQSCITNGNTVTVQTNGYMSSATITVKANTSCAISSLTASGILRIGMPIIGSNMPLQYWDGYSSYNNICNLQYYTTSMNIINADYVEWTRIAANPTSTSWSQSGNDLTLYFFNVGQNAVFNLLAANACGGVNNQFAFKSITCGGGGGGCNVVYNLYPNPASGSTKIKPNIPAPCGPVLQSLTVNGKVSVFNKQGILKKSLNYKYYQDLDIDISDLENGLYYVNIYDGTTMNSLALVVKH